MIGDVCEKVMIGGVCDEVYVSVGGNVGMCAVDNIYSNSNVHTKIPMTFFTVCTVNCSSAI